MGILTYYIWKNFHTGQSTVKSRRPQSVEVEMKDAYRILVLERKLLGKSLFWVLALAIMNL